MAAHKYHSEVSLKVPIMAKLSNVTSDVLTPSNMGSGKQPAILLVELQVHGTRLAKCRLDIVLEMAFRT